MSRIQTTKRFRDRMRRFVPACLAACGVACGLVACGPAPPPGTTGPLDLHRPQYTAEGVEGCHVCHAGDFNRAIAGTAHGEAGNPAAPYGQHGCESCHGPGSFHVSRAYGGKGLPPLTRFGFDGGASPRDEQLGACGRCHNADAPAGLAVGFVGSAHDSRFVNCSTCHAMHAAVEPLSQPGRQAAICLECHRSQRENHPRVRGREVDFAVTACGDCHDIHPAATGAEDVGFGW